jgi:hypothetical protein
MKKLLVIILAVFLSTSAFARKAGGGGGHVHVSGYHKRDGTYVQPHHRTAPDRTKLNNWSHSGNVNPYTGKVGTNTDTSPNYRGGATTHSGHSGGYTNHASGGYTQPQYQQPIGSHYVMQHQELHNTKTAKDYLD